jgi:hypothetical protein
VLPAAHRPGLCPVLHGQPGWYLPDGARSQHYYTDINEITFIYGQIRILFNKLMDPATIQPDPNVSAPPSTLRIFQGTVDVTDQFAFEYVPNSDTTYWGASIAITPLETESLLNNTTYRVVGVVKDQQGASLNVLVTVNTGPDIVVPVPAVRAK